MTLNRRSFCQKIALGLLTLGVSDVGLSTLNFQSKLGLLLKRHYQTLAAPNPRKLALLVGINKYPDNLSLKGCVTDVELQRELLINRFGFQGEDIVILTDEKATRESIETAFLEHLIKQSPDVVFFHFSGYGSQVILPDVGQKNTEKDLKSFKYINSFLPGDGISHQKRTTNNILEDTFMLLGLQLATEKITMVFDTSFSGGENLSSGSLRGRSFPTNSNQVNPEELAFCEGLKPKKTKRGTDRVNRPGIIISAAQKNQVAREIVAQDWSAGLFTYSLTQYLWEVTPASKIIIALKRATEQIETLSGLSQIPQLNTDGKSNRLSYFLMPETPTGAEGVLIELQGEELAKVKLTGLPALVVNNYLPQSCFRLLNVSPDEKQIPPGENILLKLLSRQGLTGSVTFQGGSNYPLKVGQQIQEWVRVIPRHLALVVALGNNLEKIERVDAISAFSAVENAVINTPEVASDCVFGRVNMASDDNSYGYGLFLPGGMVIPQTVGTANEAVKSAVQRLTPHLKTLLALKLWRLTLNQDSSCLKLSASLEKVGQTPQTLIRRDTRPVALALCGGQNASNYSSKLSTCPQGLSAAILKESTTNKADESEQLLTLNIGTQIQYRLENQSQTPIYFLMFGIDSSGNAIALYETESDSSQLKQQIIIPNQTLTIPNANTGNTWKVSSPPGVVETLLICAIAPFKKTLKVSQSPKEPKLETGQMRLVPNPVEIAQALWEDLDLASSVKMDLGSTSSDSYALDVNAWATFRFIYKVLGKSIK